MRHDLRATATGNSATRAAQAARANLVRTVNRDFRQFVAGFAFATNASAEKIVAFDELGSVMCGRRLAIHRRTGDVRAGLADYRKRQGKWFRRRLAFETIWKRGRTLLYGVVNPGSLGAPAAGTPASTCEHRLNSSYSTPRPPDSRNAAPRNTGHSTRRAGRPTACSGRSPDWRRRREPGRSRAETRGVVRDVRPEPLERSSHAAPGKQKAPRCGAPEVGREGFEPSTLGLRVPCSTS